MRTLTGREVAMATSRNRREQINSRLEDLADEQTRQDAEYRENLTNARNNGLGKEFRKESREYIKGNNARAKQHEDLLDELDELDELD